MIGFYLQPAVGGRDLSRDFWTRLAAIESVVGIKVAPFDRYRTLDVLHGVAGRPRRRRRPLHRQRRPHPGRSADADRSSWTARGGRAVRRRPAGPVGGLDARAVELLHEASRARAGDDAALRRCSPWTASSPTPTRPSSTRQRLPRLHPRHPRGAAPAGPAGRALVPGPGRGALPGQLAEIDRIWAAYPWLRDDDFVAGRCGPLVELPSRLERQAVQGEGAAAGAAGEVAGALGQPGQLQAVQHAAGGALLHGEAVGDLPGGQRLVADGRRASSSFSSVGTDRPTRRAITAQVLFRGGAPAVTESSRMSVSARSDRTAATSPIRRARASARRARLSASAALRPSPKPTRTTWCGRPGGAAWAGW